MSDDNALIGKYTKNSRRAMNTETKNLTSSY